MPRESTNLKLKLYNATTDAMELAKTWFNNIFDYTNSNWVKIDNAYKELKDAISSKLPLSGGALTGKITRSSGGSWILDRDNVAIFGSSYGQQSGQSYNPAIGQKTTSGAWTIGNLSGNESLIFSYTTDEDYSTGNNKNTPVYLPNQAGTIITSATIGNQSVATATKLSTSAGSATQPVYFKDGKPVATTYSLNKSVPANAKFTDTWRGIQDNLTSTSTTDSLSAKQGKALKDLIDNSPLTIYPVGSIYQSTNPTSPASLFGGTWESISSGRVLMGADDAHAAGTTAESGLPNITGKANGVTFSKGRDSSEGFLLEDTSAYTITYGWGALEYAFNYATLVFSASSSNSIYGSSNTVQPPAYFVYIWRRIE